MAAGLLAAGLSAAGLSAAGLSAAGLSAAGLLAAGLLAAGLSAAGLLAAGLSAAGLRLSAAREGAEEEVSGMNGLQKKAAKRKLGHLWAVAPGKGSGGTRAMVAQGAEKGVAETALLGLEKEVAAIVMVSLQKAGELLRPMGGGMGSGQRAQAENQAENQGRRDHSGIRRLTIQDRKDPRNYPYRQPSLKFQSRLLPLLSVFCAR